MAASEIQRRPLRASELQADSLWLAALLSLCASGIHFAVAPEHFDEYWLYGWFFVIAAWLQGVWAIALAGFGPNARLLVAGAMGNAALVALWLWTRLIGIPIGPDSGETEAFASVDGLAVACEVGVVVLAAVSLRQWRQIRPGRWTVAFVAGLSLLLIALVGIVLENDDSGGSHSDEHSEVGATE